jgi:hypothetical protein
VSFPAYVAGLPRLLQHLLTLHGQLTRGRHNQHHRTLHLTLTLQIGNNQSITVPASSNTSWLCMASSRVGATISIIGPFTLPSLCKYNNQSITVPPTPAPPDSAWPALAWALQSTSSAPSPYPHSANNNWSITVPAYSNTIGPFTLPSLCKYNNQSINDCPCLLQHLLTLYGQLT